MSDPAPAFYGSVAASGGTGDISLGAALPGHADLKTAVDIGVDQTGGGLPADRAIDYLIRYGNAREWGVGVVRVDGRFSRTAIAGTVENGVADTGTPGPLDIAAGALITWEQVGPDRTFGRLTAERDIVIDGAPDATKLTVLRTDNVARWQYGATVEDAGGDGGDFAIYRYGNDGAFLGTGLLIRRASGNILTGAELNAGGLVSQDGDIWLRNIDPGADFQTLHSVIFQGFNTAGGLRSYGAITSVAVSAASGAENGRIDLNVVDNGVMTQKINVTADGVTVKDNVVINGTVTADAFTNNSANDALSIVGGTDPATSGTIQLFGENTVFDQIDFYPEGTGTGPALRMSNTDSTFSGTVTGRAANATALIAQSTTGNLVNLAFASNTGAQVRLEAVIDGQDQGSLIPKGAGASVNLGTTGNPWNAAHFASSVTAGRLITTTTTIGGLLAQYTSIFPSSGARSFNILAPESDDGNAPFIFSTANAVTFRVDTTDALKLDSKGRAAFAGSVSAGQVSTNTLANAQGHTLARFVGTGTEAWLTALGITGNAHVFEGQSFNNLIFGIQSNSQANDRMYVVGSGDGSANYDRIAMQMDRDGNAGFGGSLTGSGYLFSADNTYSVGSASNRASVIYAATGTINTSDEAQKQDIADLTAKEKAAFLAVAATIRTYRWKDAVAAKGEGARIHTGIIAQAAIAAFDAVMGAGAAVRYGWACCDAVPVMKTRTVTKAITRDVTVTEDEPYSEIKIIDGEPVAVEGVRQVERPVMDMVQVRDAQGALKTDKDGQPVMHPVPRTETVMEEVEENYADGACDQFGIRYDELMVGIIAAMQ
ncbi:tail fiber domain-containing protein [Eilatimonas milleporae]|uniref:Endosialidase-like protein n=1 Tax=Eilatimonas milleporae TaxID=911205 RepID=A0A3M0D6K7_9PROT|nr:tail fiber domain-containing protein [Eilatimonas milleporae]RMB11913.1 endosialidase-like protein [Eilatimonas milleporae]